ncbi:unnamed protein product [Ceratitis capitata]|uniref:(Mediterranean fruit fly) hypothetical protein n=1 Tax=Ceratitis capitata TaxID=7213 RepID=A0A811TY70_CERCA|nr:unnamed protein product [Ceratitis capitata]
MSSEFESMQGSMSSPPSSPQVSKKARLDEEALHIEANAMKDKGFSLSAIEEMKTRVEENNHSGSLDQQLRQFQVLDEVQGSGSDDSEVASENGDKNYDQGDGYESSDLDIDDNEIENLLNENLPDDLKEPKKPKYEERFKTVLEEKGHNHFEVLPEGWVQTIFLGHGSVRKHAIPLGAIPCLNYRRALEEEESERMKQQLVDKVQESIGDNNQVVPSCPFAGNNSTTATEISKPAAVSPSTNGEISDTTLNTVPSTTATSADLVANVAALKSLVPPAKIVTVTENTQKESLLPDQLNDYCSKLFKFKVIRVLRFRSWNARRKFTKNRKQIKNLQRPTLPDGTKLIKFPILAQSGDSSANSRGRKEWIMNPNGKSYVCILHEYVQHALKKQPTYEFKELENAATPYSATVSINDLNMELVMVLAKNKPNRMLHVRH